MLTLLILKPRMKIGCKPYFKDYELKIHTELKNMIRQIKSAFRGIKASIGKRLDKILASTYDHYLCFYPEQRKSLPALLFRFLFSGISFEREQKRIIQNIPENSIIVYAHKYKSYFEYLFYHTRYAREGLPVPEIGFDYRFFILQPVSRVFKTALAHTRYFLKYFSIQNSYESLYIQRELKKGKSALLALVEKGGFYLRFVKSNPDPLRYLIEMQEKEKKPVYIVPQLLFFSKKPHKSTPGFIDLIFGTEEKPGMIRRLIALMRKPENVFVEISEPFNLKEFINKKENYGLPPAQSALKLRRLLLNQLNSHRRSITGPVLKSREELKENILTNDRLRAFMEQYAAKRDTPLYKIFKEADGYIDEIAARYNIRMIEIFSKVVKWIISIMFEGVSMNRGTLNRIKSMSRKGPLILVPCHKSHIDYLILSYIMYHNNMPCPHIAAGKNLSFWPLGPIFRGGGAFFIRRTFKGAVLYSKVFAEYVYKLLEEGFNIEFFIEGGRSRTGKLLQPKLGLLSILLNAYKEGACDDMIFVPVYIGYDRVPEEGAYLHELEGGKKNPESLVQVIKARKFLKKRYGTIYIKFHEGFSIRDMLEKQNRTISDMSSKELNRLCRYIGNMLVSSIDNLAVIPPHAIMAAAILNCPKVRFSFDDIMAHVETYMNYLASQKITLADTLVIDADHAFKYVFKAYINRKFIEPIKPEKDDPETVKNFTVNQSRRAALDYYKNNCIGAMAPAAITALSILERDAFQFSGADLYEGYKFLSEFFQKEFFHDPDKTAEYYVHKNIKSFIDDAILIPHPSLPDTYNITSAGFRKLKLFADFLTTYFESYKIALNFFTRYPKNFVEAKDRVRKIASMGNRMFKKKEISRFESLSRINFKNAMDFFSSHGIRGSEDEEKIEFYNEKIRNYLERLQP